MRISEITSYLESLAPLASQESYDNCGLLTGSPDMEVSNALISLDCTEEIIDEAIAKKCNLVISHHPIVFKGLKKITGKTYVERVLLKAIRNDIALYAVHTNLDNYRYGVNDKIGRLLGIENRQVLSPSDTKLIKLAVFVPETHHENVLQALFSSGAGHIGNYDECSFSVSGMGTFRAGKGANPFVGTHGERHQEPEKRVEVIIQEHQLRKVVQNMISAHPYEEVAYDLYPLINVQTMEGAGMIGELNEPESELEFLKRLKKIFRCGVIRHSPLRGKSIQRIAWCGGSGAFLIGKARQARADLFISGDIKYHDFFDAENQLIIADIGHFESEQFTIDLLAEILQEKFPTFAPCLTEINTNPVKYF